MSEEKISWGRRAVKIFISAKEPLTIRLKCAKLSLGLGVDSIHSSKGPEPFLSSDAVLLSRNNLAKLGNLTIPKVFSTTVHCGLALPGRCPFGVQARPV